MPFHQTCPGTQAARCVGQETHCIYFAGNVQAGEGLLDLWRRAQGPQNWKPVFAGSRGDGGPKDLGEEVAGLRFLGHEEGGVGGSESILQFPSQVSSTPSLPLGAVLQRLPATPSPGPRCPQPPTSTSCAGQTASQPPGPLAEPSEDLRTVWLQFPECL